MVDRHHSIDDVVVYDAADDFQFVLGGEGFDTLFFYGSKVDVELAGNGFERTQLHVTDTTGQSWNTRVDTFDRDDQEIDSYITFDDGTAQYSYFDTYNTRAWAESCIPSMLQEMLPCRSS